MLAGGFDDLSEEGSYEFANMKATSNAETEFAMGREPTEMSRPATTTRAGFMEAQVRHLDTITKIPIQHLIAGYRRARRHERENRARTWSSYTRHRGIHFYVHVRATSHVHIHILLTSPYRDKAGRSVPAPGRGALSVARQVSSKHPLPILDLAYRSRQLAFRRTQISQWLKNEHAQLKEEIGFRKEGGEQVDSEYLSTRVADIEAEAAQQEKEAQATYGMLEGADPRIAPLRRALAVWGLTADDIGVLSIHGTSTGANVWITLFCSSTLAHIPCHTGKERDKDLE
jgi:fatty acid synthase subunit alpha